MGLEAEGDEGSHDSLAHGTGVFSIYLPGAVLGLGLDELSMHLLDPFAPSRALMLVGGQGAIVAVVDVVQVETVFVQDEGGLECLGRVGGGAE